MGATIPPRFEQCTGGLIRPIKSAHSGETREVWIALQPTGVCSCPPRGVCRFLEAGEEEQEAAKSVGIRHNPPPRPIPRNSNTQHSQHHVTAAGEGEWSCNW